MCPLTHQWSDTYPGVHSTVRTRMSPNCRVLQIAIPASPGCSIGVRSSHFVTTNGISRIFIHCSLRWVRVRVGRCALCHPRFLKSWTAGNIPADAHDARRALGHGIPSTQNPSRQSVVAVQCRRDRVNGLRVLGVEGRPFTLRGTSSTTCESAAGATFLCSWRDRLALHG